MVTLSNLKKNTLQMLISVIYKAESENFVIISRDLLKKNHRVAKPETDKHLCYDYDKASAWQAMLKQNSMFYVVKYNNYL